MVEFGLLIFCLGFLHLYLSGILAFNFVFCPCPILVSGQCWPHKVSLEEIPPVFWESMRRIRVNSPLSI